jgi:hypothetical protein
MPKENIDTEAVVEAPKTDNPTPAAPAEQKEAIDPRIVEIIGEEKVESVFGEQPKVEEKPDDEAEKNVPAEEQKTDEAKQEDQENKAEVKEVEAQAATPPETKPTRLDRRLASLYIRNLHLMGEEPENIPTEEEIIADLKKYSKDEKVQAMHSHRLKNKELLGERPTGDDFDEEDKAAIQDAERESIRQDILAEEYDKGLKKGFVKFIDEHPELLDVKTDDNGVKTPNEKYDPALAQAVETLFRGGMRIDEAYKTVTKEIQRVKDAQAAAEEKKKNSALAGVLSGSGQAPINEKELDWEAVGKIQKEDPELYKKMLADGKFAHLM